MSHFLKHPGEIFQDFSLKEISHIDELDCVFREITHIPTGATIVHIGNKDPENLFCLSFQTLPKNARGAPHILEHVVLCGSKKFPVKDPFFSMSRRSLHTFMNALTGSDFTCYPAASQVEKDFYNLLEVYVDAVFHPELKKESFMQEGCRLEFETMDDCTTPLIYKGIVYNEMKGSLTPESKLWHSALEALFPDLPYAHNSGGDPQEIPHLTYEELKQFHELYYHPSRCIFFFYGSFDLKKHLEHLDKLILKTATFKPPLPPIDKQPRFIVPKKQTLCYTPNPDDLTESVFVAFSFLTAPVTASEEVLALCVLDSVLMDTDASPLKKALLQSGFCLQVDAQMDVEMSEIPFILTLKGCKKDQVDQIESFLFDTLRELSKEPFPKHLVDAALHQIELSRMELSGDHAPFGLSLFFRSVLAKQHGANPVETLKIQSCFKHLLHLLEDPCFLPSLIRKYFLENPHRVRTVMIPDSLLAQRESLEERAKLDEMFSSLSKLEVQEIIHQAKNLESMQLEDPDLECLPKITLEDVSHEVRILPLTIEKKDDFHLFHHDCFTNSLLYTDLSFDLPFVESEDLPYLQLLLTILPELGSGARNYVQNLEYLVSHTGGIGLSSFLHLDAKNPHNMNPSILIRGKALERNTHRLLPFLRDILVSPDLKDRNRIKELVLQIYSSLQSRITKNGIRYAIYLSLSGFSQSTYFTNECTGLPYYHFIETLALQIDKNIDQLIEKLENVHANLFLFQNLSAVFSCNHLAYKNSLEFLPNLPKNQPYSWEQSWSLTPMFSQGRVIASPVAYNVESYQVCSYTHVDAPALTVAAPLLENLFLHRKIREIGGAYGASAGYNSATGSFHFHSYRDPHISASFAAFEEALEKLCAGKFSDQDLEEAKLSVIQQLDMPISPGSLGITAYNWLRSGKTTALRQQYRSNILNLSKQDLIQGVSRQLLNQIKNGIQVSFANKDLLEKEAPRMNSLQKPLTLLAF